MKTSYIKKKSRFPTYWQADRFPNNAVSVSRVTAVDTVQSEPKRLKGRRVWSVITFIRRGYEETMACIEG